MATMSSLDVHRVRPLLSGESVARLDELEAFASIASTNTYLLSQPPPASGRFRVALADHQTAGRGRHDRRWLSPPGSGLCLSLAYTFAGKPEQLPVLTLALGVGIVEAMRELKVEGITLKWPNDIVALDGKLGGVLTEVQSPSLSQPGAGVTVVTGVGLNIDLPEQLGLGGESDWAHRAVDLKSIMADYPACEIIAARLIDCLVTSMAAFEEHGFGFFSADWRCHDWLHGKQITVDMPDGQISGVAAGIDTDGALLVDAGSQRIRVISGSVVMATQ